jgi:DNA processing protein
MDKAEWVALSILPGIGGVTIRRLLAHFGAIADVLSASESELCAVRGVGKHIAGAIRHASVDSTRALLARLSEEGIYPLTWLDEGFPANLMASADAPPLLFVRGSLEPADDVSAAIVGRRAASPEALEAAAHIAGELARRGITIVSGLAIGVDTAAHRGALEAGGRTVAVLGSGIRAIHPQRNRHLADRVSRQGALLSELYPDTGPTPTQLVARDRIVSGLSRWTIVVESNMAGGSMRTAEFARRQRRVLAARPGSPGTDRLIADGAEVIDPTRIDWDRLAHIIRETRVQAAPSGDPGHYHGYLLESESLYTRGGPTSETSHRQSCRSDTVRE